MILEDSREDRWIQDARAKDEAMARLAPAVAALKEHVKGRPQIGAKKFIEYVLKAHPPKLVSVRNMQLVTEGLAEPVTRAWPLRAQIDTVLNPAKFFYDVMHNKTVGDLDWRLL